MKRLLPVLFAGLVILAACGGAGASDSPHQPAPVCCNANGGVGTTPYGPSVPGH